MHESLGVNLRISPQTNTLRKTTVLPMILCQVTGTVVASQKSERLRAARMLIVEPVDLAGRLDGSGDMLALDPKCDAGVGDYVLVAKEGDVVKQLMDEESGERTPANVIIIAVVDDWEQA
jgi:microcompartment protein CcmK/EutM